MKAWNNPVSGPGQGCKRHDLVLQYDVRHGGGSPRPEDGDGEQ